MHKIICLLIASGVFALDRLVKLYINLHISSTSALCPFYPYGGIGVFQGWLGGIDFSINHVTNTGAAWGFFAAFAQVLLFFRIALIIGLAGYLFFFNRFKERQIPLLLILTGAVSNVVDHFLYGHVIDMFHFTFWGFSFAVFNIADAAIFCGVVLILFGATVERSWKFLCGLFCQKTPS